jgi:6-phosphogluconolactonase (cycloisomerase 2 family)
MTSEPGPAEFPIEIEIPSAQWLAAPGKPSSLAVQLINRGTVEEVVALSIKGIPSNWLKEAYQSLHLFPGEQKDINLVIAPPEAPAVHAGRYPVQVQVARTQDPTRSRTADALLTVAAFELQGRIGVLMDATQYTVAPGSSVAVTFTLLNQGLEADTFRLAVEGVPIAWVSTATPTLRLNPGEQKQASILIQPPRNSQSKVGRTPFVLHITSQVVPGQPAAVNLLLTIAAYTQYKSALSPHQVKVGEPFQVIVENQGNIQETFTLGLESPNQSLTFEPAEAGAPSIGAPTASGGQAWSLRVLAGETASAAFRASPRQRPWLGGQKPYPFSVNITSGEGKSQSHNGQATGQGLIPLWLIAATALVLVCIFCSTVWILSRSSSNKAEATQTALARQMNQIVQATLDAATRTAQSSGATLSAQSAAATQTAMAIQFTQIANATFSAATQLGQAVGATQTTIAQQLTQSANATSVVQTQIADAIAQTQRAMALTQTAAVPVIPTPSPTSTIPPTKFPTPTTRPSLPGVIVFESNRNGDRDLYRLDLANNTLIQLTHNTGSNTQPSISPDGGKIAFATNRDGNTEVYIMNADGSGQKNLTNNPAEDNWPAWSPDGQWIAFTSTRDGNQEIYLMKPDGSDVHNLTNNLAADMQPAWLQSKLLFISNRDGNQEIYSMNMDGTGEVNLTNNLADDFNPAGSLDGQHIAFASNRNGQLQVFIMLADGSSQTLIASSNGDNSQPTWSLDNQWIGFTSSRTGNNEIFVMKPDGSNAFNLTNNPAQDQNPAWH